MGGMEEIHGRRHCWGMAGESFWREVFHARAGTSLGMNAAHGRHGGTVTSQKRLHTMNDTHQSRETVACG